MMRYVPSIVIDAQAIPLFVVRFLCLSEMPLIRPSEICVNWSLVQIADNPKYVSINVGEETLPT